MLDSLEPQYAAWSGSGDANQLSTAVILRRRGKVHPIEFSLSVGGCAKVVDTILVYNRWVGARMEYHR